MHLQIRYILFLATRGHVLPQSNDRCDDQSSLNEINKRIGRLRERQYQLSAQRRNEAALKFDHYREVAKYFERECGKATQFNAWNIDNSKREEKLKIRKKNESLELRREKLRELLKTEEVAYRRECELLKTRRAPRVDYSVSILKDRLKENRAEQSLYRPKSCRRIQSYLYGAYGPRQDTHTILKEFNSHDKNKNSKMSAERIDAREDHGDLWDKKSEVSDYAPSNIGDNQDIEQEGYNKRMAEYKENSRSARASNLYGYEHEPETHISRTKSDFRPAAGLSTHEHRPHSRKLHDSHFLLGNEVQLNEEGSNHKEPNQRFTERYANRSLDGTNVGETAGHGMNEGQLEQPQEYENENEVANADETDDANEMVRKMSIMNEEYNKEKGEVEETGSMKDNASGDSRQTEDEIDEQRAIDKEVGAKASAGRSDHRHFETEKSLPWMRMIPGDKNLSEQMFLYLTHNELKGRIQDLEKRENQAASKHQWDEALRLRDMRNRLDLARERNLYRREDLMLDPELKRQGMAGIEARSKLLKEREILCTNSSMYSEEAKVMWDQWVIEDEKTVFEDARLLREDLMNQLEENWRSLAVEDKQRISDSFNKDYIELALQNEQDALNVLRSASR